MMDLFFCKNMWLIVIISCATVVTSAEPKPTHKSRVVNRAMSDEKHFKSDDHNVEYDHDAFVGHDEAEEYDELPPEESQKRLGGLFLKIDINGDHQVTSSELESWIRKVQLQSLEKETETEWKKMKSKMGDYVTWADYLQHQHADQDPNEEYDEDEVDEKKRDERRWKMADSDNDGILNKKEFTDFLHPEDAAHMKESIIQDVLDEVDKDHDGYVSMQEYLEDLATVEDEEDEEDDEDSGWTSEDEAEFRTDLDTNHDGKLDTEEIYRWIVPKDYDHIMEETNHLMQQADMDKDGSLTAQEMIDKYDVFVGSQATNYGSFFGHEEL